MRKWKLGIFVLFLVGSAAGVAGATQSNQDVLLSRLSLGDRLSGLPLDALRLDDALRNQNVYGQGGDLLEQFIRFIFPITGREKRTMFMPLPYWGPKKPQFKEFDWHRFESQHFNFLTYPEGEEMLPKVVEFIESDHERNNRVFGVHNRFTKKIPILFYQSRRDFEQSNVVHGPVPEGLGGLTEIFSWRRMVFPFEGEMETLEHVAKHEAVHVYQIAKGARRFPLWFIEGEAETNSIKWDAQAEISIRDAYVNDLFFPIDDLWVIQGTWLMYKIGNYIVNLMWDRYGEEGFRKLHENGTHMSFEDNLKKSLNLTLEELNAWVQGSLETKYGFLKRKKDLASRSQTIAEEQRVLHARDRFFISGGVSGPRNALYLNHLGLDGKVTKEEIVSDRRFRNESLASFRKGAWIGAKELVYAIRRSRRDVIRVVPFSFDKEEDCFQLGEPQEYSWDDLDAVNEPVFLGGSELAFIGEENGFTDIYRFDWTTQGREKLTNKGKHISGLDYSPTRKVLVFSQEDEPMPFTAHYDRNLYTLDLGTRKVTQITHTNQLRETSPRFSPNGQKLLYVFDPSGTYDLGEYDFEKQKSQRLTKMKVGALHPQWFGDESLLFNHFEKFAPSIVLATYPSPKEKLQAQVPEGNAVRVDLKGAGLLLSENEVKEEPKEMNSSEETNSFQVENGKASIFFEDDPFRVLEAAHFPDEIVFKTQRGGHGLNSAQVDDRFHYFRLRNGAVQSLSALTIARKGAPKELMKRMDPHLGGRSVVETWTSYDRKQVLVLVNNRLADRSEKFEDEDDLQMFLFDTEGDTMDAVEKGPLDDLDENRLQWVSFLADGKVFFAKGDRPRGPFELSWYDRIFKTHQTLDRDVRAFRISPNRKQIAWRRSGEFWWISTDETQSSMIEGVEKGTGGRTAFRYLLPSKLMFFAAKKDKGVAQIFQKGEGTPQKLWVSHDQKLELHSAAIDSESPLVAIRAKPKKGKRVPEKLFIWNYETQEMKDISGEGLRFPYLVFRRGYLTFLEEKKDQSKKEAFQWKNGIRARMNSVKQVRKLEEFGWLFDEEGGVWLFDQAKGVNRNLAEESAGFDFDPQGDRLLLSQFNKDFFQIQEINLLNGKRNWLTNSPKHSVYPIVHEKEMVWSEKNEEHRWVLRKEGLKQKKSSQVTSLSLKGYDLIQLEPRKGGKGTIKAFPTSETPKLNSRSPEKEGFPRTMFRYPQPSTYKVQSLSAAAAYDGDHFRYFLSGFADNLFSDRGFFVNSMFLGDAKFANAGFSNLTTGNTYSVFYNSRENIDNVGARFTKQFVLDRYRELSTYGDFETQFYGKQTTETQNYVTPEIEDRNFYIVKTGAVYAYDVTVWDRHGPTTGSRIFLRTEAGFDAGNSRLANVDANLDFRLYNRFLPRFGLAHRIVAGTSQGDLANVFLIGGNLSFRGVGFDEMEGQNYWVFSEDLRLPLFDFVGAKFFDPLDQFLGWLTRYFDVRGGIYTDVGAAWFNGEKHDVKYSVGYFVNVPTVLGLTFRWNQGFAGEDGIDFWIGYNW